MLYLTCAAIAFIFVYVDSGDFWDSLGMGLFAGGIMAMIIFLIDNH